MCNSYIDKYFISWYILEKKNQLLVSVRYLQENFIMHRAENLSLAAEAAKLYYLEQKTQNEISRMMGRSRSTIIRLLKLARDENLVDIYIRDIADPEVKSRQLAQKLCDLFGILDRKYTRVLYTHSVGDMLNEKLGKLGARVLEEIISQIHKEKSSNPNVSSRVKLGISFGNQLRYVVDFSYPKKICEDLHAVALIGGFGRSEKLQRNSSNELARRIAKHYRGSWEQLLCPSKVSSVEVKRILEKEEIVSRVIREGKNCDIYLTGLGGIRSDFSVKFVSVEAGLIDEELLMQMSRTEDVVGTMCAQMYNIDGDDCPYPAEGGAIIGISLNDMRRSIRNGSYVLLVAGGETRYRAILGALRTGCVNCIVTDRRCTEWIIEQETMKQSSDS